ncbi:MAG: hypothetical protein R3F34_08260 [Planctomycetota bacterium]
MSAYVPAVARVLVLHDGRREAGLEVVAARELPDGNTIQSGAITDDEGIATIPKLYPGTWRFAVSDAGGAWESPIPGEHLLGPGDDVELRADVRTAAGRVVVVDENGEPVRRHRLDMRLSYVIHGVTTDSEGGLDLTLCTGEHTLTDRDGRSCTLEWTESGPTTEKVVLVER